MSIPAFSNQFQEKTQEENKGLVFLELLTSFVGSLSAG